VKNFLLLCVTCILMVATLEITLRFFPVATSLRTVSVNDHNSTFHAEPNQDVIYSTDWNLVIVNNKHVNNVGFLNKFDYNAADPRKLVAVVGDSYVAAMEVNDDEPFYQTLSRDNPDLRVYSFGFGHGGLSQYLIWAKYAHDNFRNDFLIVSVVGNDFDESLKKYKFKRGFYHYDEQADGSLVLVRNDYEPNPYIRWLLYNSQLARYLLLNCKAFESINLLKHKFSKQEKYVDNMLAQVDSTREQDSYRAIDAFLRDLPQYSGLQPPQILLMTNALRESIYNSADEPLAKNSYVAKMYHYLLTQAHLLGYNTLDLHPPFSEHYKHHQQRFEFPTDGHWNALAHQIVAQSIETTPWWQYTVKNMQEVQ